MSLQLHMVNVFSFDVSMLLQCDWPNLTSDANPSMNCRGAVLTAFTEGILFGHSVAISDYRTAPLISVPKPWRLFAEVGFAGRARVHIARIRTRMLVPAGVPPSTLRQRRMCINCATTAHFHSVRCVTMKSDLGRTARRSII